MFVLVINIQLLLDLFFISECYTHHRSTSDKKASHNSPKILQPETEISTEYEEGHSSQTQEGKSDTNTEPHVTGSTELTFRTDETSISETSFYTSDIHEDSISSTTSTNSFSLTSTTTMTLTTSPQISDLYDIIQYSGGDIECKEKRFIVGLGYDTNNGLKEMICFFLNIENTSVVMANNLDDTEENAEYCSKTLDEGKIGAANAVKITFEPWKVGGDLKCAEFSSTEANNWDVTQEITTSYSNLTSLPEEIKTKSISSKFCLCPVSLREENTIWVADSLFEYDQTPFGGGKYGIKCRKMIYIPGNLENYLINSL